ncbi:hypothetical protein KUTeg_002685 [Tegillarca granosa]|uniref:ATP-grasp domain-containing protein n=1 Tax=Tegillarca granosa TaxID=220873 RepID=A0ABQ9FV23_TEGGR|nr:hypothetical protein KUTeg_002685 [Tegillarca granosa]
MRYGYIESMCKFLIIMTVKRTDTGKSVDQDVKDDGSKQPKKDNGGKKSPATRVPKLPACSLPANMVPTFFVGGAPLVALGWKRTTDKYDERFRLKWVECKTRINYGGFKEGEQLVNHIPNCNLLTNKLGLLNSLQEYERVTLSTKGRPPRLRFSDFVPETYRLDEKNDRELFLNTYKDGETWICKPTGMNQGKGIFLLRSQEEITKLLEEREQKKEKMSKTRTRPLMTRLVQRYIENPLLLDGRKFDIRAYMLIASTVPFLVLYQKGYVRLSCNKYIHDDNNLTTHLTNQFIQKKDPNYKEKQMQKIMIHLFNSVKHKLQARTGFFDLYGLDFMVDTDMKIWLIEVNINPALHINCEALKEVIPGVVEENLAIECFEKTKKNLPLMPLQSLNNFTVLYCGTRPFCVAPRQTRSVSPVKENSLAKTNSLSFSTAQPRRTMSPVRTMHRMTTQSTPVVSGANSNKVEASSNSEQSAGAVPKSASVAKSAVQRSQNLSTDESVKLKMTHTDAATVATAGNSTAQTSSTRSSNTTTTSSQSKPISSVTTLPNIAKSNTSSTSVSMATSSISMPTNVVTQSSISKTSPTVSTSSAAKSANTTKTSKLSDLGVSLSIPTSNTAIVLKPAVVTPNYDLETTLSFKRSRDRDRPERGN